MSKTVKYVFIVISMTLLAKIIGFARDIVMAGVLGATQYTDAYLIALSIPEMVLFVFINAFGTIFIPIFSKIKKNSGSDSASEFTSNVFNIMLLFGIVLSVLGVIFTKQIISVLAPGFKPETFNLTVSFARILLWSTIFFAGNCILTAYLQLNENFAIPAALSIPYNIIISASMFLSLLWGIKTLVYGSLLAVAVQFSILLLAARKKSFRFRRKLDIKDSNVREMSRLTPPLMMSAGISQVQSIVDKILVSHMIAGSFTALSIGQRIYSFVVEIFTKSVMTVAYPLLSNTYAENNIGSLKYSAGKALIIVTLLTSPISALIFALHTPIIKVLFERGSFGPAATQMTSIALSFLSLGILFAGISETLSSIFYSMKDTKTPLMTSVASMAVNISLKLVLVAVLGLGGIALASSLSSFFSATLLGYFLKKRLGPFTGMHIFGVFARVIASSIMSGAIARASYEYLMHTAAASMLGGALSLGASLALGAATYSLFVLLFKVKEAHEFMSIVKNKIKSQLRPD